VQTTRTAALCLVLASVLTSAIAPATSAAAPATLGIAPANAAVAQGQTFELQVVQDSPIATSGAQASVSFDPAILQIVSVSAGPAYARAPIFEPPDLATDVLHANMTGRLAQLAAAFTPPASVPAGTGVFLVIRFRAVGCGQTDIGLPAVGPFNAQMISGEASDYGNVVPLTTTGGHVTTCVTPSVAAAASTDTSASGTGAVGVSLPLALLGVAAFISLGLFVALALRVSRRERTRNVAE
jgi:hypothetical protein